MLPPAAERSAHSEAVVPVMNIVHEHNLTASDCLRPGHAKCAADVSRR
jgi:hypothetical protein